MILERDTFNIPPLFHGTDARMVQMSETERKEYKVLCSLSIDYLWIFFESYNANYTKMMELKELLNSANDPNLFANVMDKISIVGGMKNGNPSYQYNHFYLTNVRDRACNYAHRAFAGGEYGLIVHRLYTAVNIIGFKDWAPSKDVKEAISTIERFANDKKQPVIFEFTNLDPELLELENGRPIDLHNLNDVGVSLRYSKDVKLDINKAIYI